MTDDAISSPSHPGPALSRWLNVFAAWGVWAVMLAANLAVVYQYSPRQMPMSDELQELGGGAELTWRWLWEQHAEHRIPLSKLIWLGTLKISNYDFRVGNLAEVIAVGLVAMTLMLAVRRIRGSTRWTDAFFPLVLLNFGQTYPVFLWWWQVNHTLPPLLACLLLVVAFRNPNPNARELVISGLLLVLLSVSGPGGLPYVPPLALWLGWNAVRSPSVGDWRARVTALVLVAAAVAMVAFYFVRFDRHFGAMPPAELDPDGIKASLKTSIQLLSVSLGTKTGETWKAWGLLAAVFWACGVFTALVAVFTRPAERNRAMGLSLFLCGSAALLLVLGWARANYPHENTFEGHYLTKGVPALCCVYLLFAILCRPSPAAELQGCMFIAAVIPCIFFVLDRKTILQVADRRLHATYEMADDLDGGMSAYAWHQKHKEFQGMAGVNPYVVAQFLQHLRDLGVPPFVKLQDEKELPISPDPVSMNEVSRTGEIFEMIGDDPAMIYSLDRPRHVVAVLIRITYLNETKERPALLQLYWKNGAQNFAEDRSFVLDVPADGQQQTIAVPVDATIDGFRLDPDSRRGKFKIAEIILLTPRDV
jgi:hypothetical protein